MKLVIAVAVVAVFALGHLSACVGATVEVTPVGPVPPGMQPRAPETVKHFELRPDNAVEVYDIEAYGDAKAKLLAVIRQRAATLGCDGLMFSAPSRAARADTPAETTGQLNEHHQKPGTHVEAVCLVMQAAAPEPAQ